MSKKHDENKDLKSFARIGRVDTVQKTLKASKSAVIGIHLWGKIDFLSKYCGYVFIWENDVKPSTTQSYDERKKKEKKLKKLKR